jgi:hypothetical protein
MSAVVCAVLAMSKPEEVDNLISLKAGTWERLMCW